MESLTKFLAEWQGDERDKKAKATFKHFKNVLESLAGVKLSFIARESVTYSLRARNDSQNEDALFVMVDVIEDSPRWLSVCFYAQMITDPENLGDFVPEGLLGEDALCFDLENTAIGTELGENEKNWWNMLKAEYMRLQKVHHSIRTARLYITAPC